MCLVVTQQMLVIGPHIAELCLWLLLHQNSRIWKRGELLHVRTWRLTQEFARQNFGKEKQTGIYFNLTRGRIAQQVRQLATGWTVRIPVGSRFSVPVQTGTGAHPTSCTMGTGSFTEVKSGWGVTLNPHPLLMPWS